MRRHDVDLTWISVCVPVQRISCGGLLLLMEGGGGVVPNKKKKKRINTPSGANTHAMCT